MKRDLNASKVYSSMAIFTMLESQLSNLGSFANELTAAKASLDRLNTFLHEVTIDYPDAIRLQSLTYFESQTELLDAFNSKTKDAAVSAGDDRLGFGRAYFSWKSSEPGSDGTSTSRRKREFQIRIEDELIFKRNCINLVVGPTASGKTSLLMALLGTASFHLMKCLIDRSNSRRNAFHSVWS